ncbi:MAG: ABC transporter ATP-binding protein [Candidatus Microthrix sp.]|jgi:ABC-2 type transport system ATP-binding protein|uniref:ABC transporter ATP-binding protein n=1 Tax=Candidatus Neomicrothrix TaxID=41949 RepID=UPI0003706F11|nr:MULTISPECIES: ABC transporter ATP-binding protein [Microthrix]MBK7018220.1 ABC transporter ATP-binding protein [Candidatus Microthrix sp.]MBP6135440.1 ABC transporter ATP-binding protein [Candidatus Microthrix sp.]MBP6150002.1 ABC transporter ATP-binding protein [Candidatus Microthrix sp.]MBP7405005.1 ABC transporter ATP-binding protein [Candidatus Microthrix sp.]MBP7987208.1 ABC transporter ATP-binding protein [Candidatus Microthrix sp.]
MVSALSTRDLAKAFGSNVAVAGLNLEVPRASCFGLIGPNGSGKTTTMRMCAGLLRPDRGGVLVDGIDVWADPVEARRRVGVVPDPLLLFERLTGIEQLVHIGLLRNLGRIETETRSRGLLEVLGLTEAADEAIGDYSHGMRKKLSLATALLHRPALLLLDEPFEGVDPVSAMTVRQVLDRYREAGGTVVVSSHVMEVLQKVCDHVAIIRRGEVLAAGAVEELSGNSTLEDAFISIVGEAPTDAALLDWLDAPA